MIETHNLETGSHNRRGGTKECTGRMGVYGGVWECMERYGVYKKHIGVL